MRQYGRPHLALAGLLVHSSDSVKLFSLANTGMLQLTDWLKVNKHKTCYSIFGPNCKKGMTLSLNISGKLIQNVNYCKYLDIMVDNDLKWKNILIMSVIN